MTPSSTLHPTILPLDKLALGDALTNVGKVEGNDFEAAATRMNSSSTGRKVGST